MSNAAFYGIHGSYSDTYLHSGVYAIISHRSTVELTDSLKWIRTVSRLDIFSLYQ